MPAGSATGARLDRAIAAMTRPGALVAAGVVLAVAAFHLWITPSNPPGFLHDEASMAYNATTISHSLRDENGGLLPLYLKSFGDYKSPLFTYTLAAVFRVTGPHQEVARGVAAVAVLAGVLLLGLVAYRRTRSGVVALAVVVLAGLTPGLYEVGRAAYEVSLQPLLLGLLLLALDSACRVRGWTVGSGVAVGLALVGLCYSYAAGRLLAPLLALALLVFAGRGRWRGLVAAGATFAVGLVPLGVYALRHPGALTERYDQTTFVDSTMSWWTIVSRAASNYVTDADLWHWLVSGDPKPYVHTAGPTLYAGGLLLAVAGAVVVLARKRSDLWWRYVLVATVLAPVPAALTKDRYYALRLVPLFVLLVVLAIPALEALVRSARTGWPSRVALAVLALAVGVQYAQFLHTYRTKGPARTTAFNAGIPALMAQAFAGGRTVYVDYDESHALAYARWYAAEHGLPSSRVVRLPDGGIPPTGSVVAVRFLGCDFTCVEIARSGDYWLARVEGPKAS